ncbi:MAG: hypothetical protein R2857_13585 [Vampirovibrionales bacterium]
MDMLSSQTDRVLDKALDGTMMRPCHCHQHCPCRNPALSAVKVDFEDQPRHASRRKTVPVPIRGSCRRAA